MEIHSGPGYEQKKGEEGIGTLALCADDDDDDDQLIVIFKKKNKENIINTTKYKFVCL